MPDAVADDEVSTRLSSSGVVVRMSTLTAFAAVTELGTKRAPGGSFGSGVYTPVCKPWIALPGKPFWTVLDRAAAWARGRSLAAASAARSLAVWSLRFS